MSQPRNPSWLYFPKLPYILQAYRHTCLQRNEAGERVSSRMVGIGLARFRQLADGDEIDTNTIRAQQWEKGISCPVLVFRHQIGGWFNDNMEVQAYVATLIILLMVYQFGDGLQYTFANALRGIACVKPMVLYAFIAYFVISLPLGYTLGFPCGLGILGIWLAFPFGLTIAGEMYRRRFEKELKKIEKE